MNNHQMKELSSAERFHAMMEDLGFKKHLSPAVLAAALDLHEGRLPRPDLLNEARNFFATRAIFVPHGLEGLPSIWLSRLSEIHNLHRGRRRNPADRIPTGTMGLGRPDHLVGPVAGCG